MKKRLTFLGVIATVATCAVVFASLVPASSQQAATKTIAVCEVNNKGVNKNIDVGKHGFSAGDYSMFSLPGYSVASGKRMSTDVGRLTVVNLVGKNNGRFIVDATLTFKAGKVSTYGPGLFSNFRKGINFPVTGGTGAYRQADGTVTAKNGACRGKPGTRLTLDLTLQ